MQMSLDPRTGNLFGFSISRESPRKRGAGCLSKTVSAEGCSRQSENKLRTEPQNTLLN
jgi:hypothetical protein